MGLWGVQMYIRHRDVSGHRYFYLCRCRRDGVKVIQETLAYLGRHSTVDECIAYHRDMIHKWQSELDSISESKRKRRASLERWILKSQSKLVELESLSM